MIDAIRLFVGTILRLFRTRRKILLENLALRQQFAVLKRKTCPAKVGTPR